MWKFDDSVKAHLLIPQLVARGYPLEIFGFALVDTQNHRDVFKLATDTATSSLVVHPAFWQIVSRAAFGPELFCLNWSKLWGMWFLSTPGFWQTPDASATLDGALFNKAQIIDCFSRDVEMQTWKRAAGHSLSSGMEKGTNTDLCQEGQVSADQRGKFHGCTCAGLSCLWADGSIPNQFFCVRCDQRALATRKHELWECPGNRLINHTHMKESDHLVTLAQEFWDTDQVLFARGLLPRDWLPARELAECSEVRMWESSGFKESASDTVLVASDGSGGSRETRISLRQVAFGVATFSLQPLSDTSFKLLRTRFLGRSQVPGRQMVPRAELWGSFPDPQPSRREVECPNSD